MIGYGWFLNSFADYWSRGINLDTFFILRLWDQEIWFENSKGNVQSRVNTLCSLASFIKFFFWRQKEHSQENWNRICQFICLDRYQLTTKGIKSFVYKKAFESEAKTFFSWSLPNYSYLDIEDSDGCCGKKCISSTFECLW